MSTRPSVRGDRKNKQTKKNRTERPRAPPNSTDFSVSVWPSPGEPLSVRVLLLCVCVDTQSTDDVPWVIPYLGSRVIFRPTTKQHTQPADAGHLRLSWCRSGLHGPPMYAPRCDATPSSHLVLSLPAAYRVCSGPHQRRSTSLTVGIQRERLSPQHTQRGRRHSGALHHNPWVFVFGPTPTPKKKNTRKRTANRPGHCFSLEATWF